MGHPVTQWHLDRNRLRIGILVPETNTTLRADFSRLSAPDVATVWEELSMGTGHMANDAEHADVIAAARGSVGNALDRVVALDPDCVVMGFVIDTFWGGREGSLATVARLREAAEGRPVITGGDAALAALHALDATRVGVVTPYQPAADEHVRRFFEESGIQVLGLSGLRAPTASAIAELDADRLADAMRGVGSGGVDAIVQCGTNVSLLDQVEPLEQEIGIPILTMNALLYWHSLRTHGISDRCWGMGHLMSAF